MVILICGASHTGKTYISQKLLEHYHYPYLSLDHLKMGLYRGNKSKFTPLSLYKDITEEMWDVVVGIIKTNIENKQNLIIEGCFIPKDFSERIEKEYLKDIKYMCIILSERYIDNNFDKIVNYANVIETRIDDVVEKGLIKRCNKAHLENCIKRGYHYYLVDNHYDEKEILKDFIETIDK